MFTSSYSRFCVINVTVPIYFRRLFSTTIKRSTNDVNLNNTNKLKTTILHQFHVNHGGKMVPFAGYSMPVVYSDLSITESHLHTRSKSSVFDVSHMLQTRIHGKDRFKLAEDLTVADVKLLEANQGCLSLFTNDSGGIIDDLIITNTDSSYLYIVSNAGCMEKDKALLESHCQKLKNDGKDVALEFINQEYSLLALQGPLSMNYLQPHVDVDLKNLYFMFSAISSIAGVDGCRITRCGYTGEDGFELSIPNGSVETILETLLDSSDGNVKLAGLGARDTLRLEAGLCLYGNDIDEKTTPIEAGLTWTIGKARRERKDFPGAEIIMKQLKDKPSRRRIGLKSLGKGAPARQGNEVLDDQSNQQIGLITSGCPSPSLTTNIAMAYVKAGKGKVGTTVKCSIRGKQYEYEVTKMPFIPSNYYTRP